MNNQRNVTNSGLYISPHNKNNPIFDQPALKDTKVKYQIAENLPYDFFFQNQKYLLKVVFDDKNAVILIYLSGNRGIKCKFWTKFFVTI